MVLLIDGYNLIGPVAAPRGFSRANRTDARDSTSWLQVERMRLLDRLATHLGELVCERTCVVFDAKNAPRGRASEMRHQSIQVRYAVDYPEADDLLEELIRNHSTPKRLTVISSDHRVQSAARRRKATYFDSDPWYDDLLDGKVRLGWYPRTRLKPKLPSKGKPPGESHAVNDQAKNHQPQSDNELSGLQISDEDLRKWIDHLGD